MENSDIANLLIDRFTESEEYKYLNINEIKTMKDVCISLFDKADKKGLVDEVSTLEEKTDNMTKEYRVNMLKRLQNGICTSEGSIIYSEILIDFERVGDHLLNVSENFNKINV